MAAGRGYVRLENKLRDAKEGRNGITLYFVLRQRKESLELNGGVRHPLYTPTLLSFDGLIDRLARSPTTFLI